MTGAPERLTQARLPRWGLPPAWPMHAAKPTLADLRLRDVRAGRVAAGVAPPAWRGLARTDALDLEAPR